MSLRGRGTIDYTHEDKITFPQINAQVTFPFQEPLLGYGTGVYTFQRILTIHGRIREKGANSVQNVHSSSEEVRDAV